MESIGMKLKLDASPLRLFAEFVETALEVKEGTFNFRDFGSELLRIETEESATIADEFIIHLYPSDRFMRAAAAVFAGDGNLSSIENRSHDNIT